MAVPGLIVECLGREIQCIQHHVELDLTPSNAPPATQMWHLRLSPRYKSPMSYMIRLLTALKSLYLCIRVVCVFVSIYDKWDVPDEVVQQARLRNTPHAKLDAEIPTMCKQYDSKKKLMRGQSENQSMSMVQERRATLDDRAQGCWESNHGLRKRYLNAL